MKIIQIDIPSSMFDDGLGDIQMDRLSDIVIIAGRNGVGKSRLFNRLKKCVESYLDEETVEELRRSIKAHANANKSGDIPPRQKDNNSNYIKSLEDRLIYQDKITFDKHYGKYEVIEFVPNQLQFIPPENQNPSELDSQYQQCLNSKGINNVGNATFIYIQKLCSRYINATHQEFSKDESEKEKAIEAFNGLGILIREFLGTKLTWDVDGNAVLFGLPLSKSNLSDGQRVLLQLCVAIHAQKASLDNLILLLDEPENHLHPEALIQYIKSVRNVLKNGQIWIATHSIHLMSALDTSYIWYMDNQSISYSGRAPEKVLQGLLGSEDEISKLQDFLNLPAELAVNHFAAECLMPLNVSGAGVGDKQTNQIWDAIKKNVEARCCKILDYGAGKGRLADAYYFSTLIQERELVKDKINYIAYDSSSEHAKKCKDAIIRIYGNSDKRYFTNEVTFISDSIKESFDVVVMCNVLHEIPPVEWIKTFKESGCIGHCLKPNGYLLIVEDLLIPIGETPHKDGYFVLGMAELKMLFNIPANASDIILTFADERERLMACLIPKKYLSNIKDNSVKDAIKMLHKHAKNEIPKCRKDMSYKGGKSFAFWTQQLANTTLFLDLE